MRQSFPQGQSPVVVVEVDLKSGINLQDPPCDIMRGQQSIGLRRSKNLVWQPHYANVTTISRNGFAYPCVPIADGTTWTPGSNKPSHILGRLYLPAERNRKLIVGRLNGSPWSIQVWRLSGANIYEQAICGGTSAIGTSTSTDTALPIVQAYWRSANLNHEARDLNNDGDMTDSGEPAVTSMTKNGILFFSHPCATHIYMVDNNGSSNTDATTPSPASPDPTKWYIRSYTNIGADADYSLHRDYNTVAPPAGASALKIYLDRLWMAHSEDLAFFNTAQGRTTTLWYTDPFNWRSIRANNFIIVEDEVRALALPASGGIGIGGQAQLVIFNVSSINVLDGDPSQGNTYYRTLANDIGVVSQNCVVETPYGIVAITTDEQVYLIPPGAQRLIPIGDAIRPIISGNRNDNISYQQPTAQVFWHAPYVYAVFSSTGEIYMFDLSHPDNPKWWGPINADSPQEAYGMTAPGQINSASSTLTEFYTHRPAGESDVITKTILETKPTNSYIVNIANEVVTGSINVPGHRVQLEGVIIQQARVTTPPVLNVTATTAEGNVTTGILYNMPTAFPVYASANNSVTYVDNIRYSFAHTPVISDSFFLTIAGNSAGEEPYIYKVYAVIRVQPLQW